MHAHVQITMPLLRVAAAVVPSQIQGAIEARK